jgi:hypothetical protein
MSSPVNYVLLRVRTLTLISYTQPAQKKASLLNAKFRCSGARAGSMVPAKFFKQPVRCAAYGSRQYETLLWMPQGRPFVCVGCHQDIDLQRSLRNGEMRSGTLSYRDLAAVTQRGWLGVYCEPAGADH